MDQHTVSRDINAVFRRLRALDRQLAPDTKHDRVHALIGACVSEGIDRGSRITGALAKLGYNKRHVGKTLHDGLRPGPEGVHWYRSADGTYHLPSPVELAA